MEKYCVFPISVMKLFRYDDEDFFLKGQKVFLIKSEIHEPRIRKYLAVVYVDSGGNGNISVCHARRCRDRRRKSKLKQNQKSTNKNRILKIFKMFFSLSISPLPTLAHTFCTWLKRAEDEFLCDVSEVEVLTLKLENTKHFFSNDFFRNFNLKMR